MTAQLYPSNKTLALLVLIVLAFVFLTRCKSIDKATQQVLTNAPAFNKVGAVWAGLHPCVKDSVLRVTHDTTYVSDTSYTGPVQNGYTQTQPKYSDTATPRFRSLSLSDLPTRTITHIIRINTDSDKVEQDMRQIGLLNDRINSLLQVVAGDKGAVDARVKAEQDKTTTAQGKANKRGLIMCGLVAILVGIIGLKIYNLVSGKKLLKLI